VLVVIEPVTFEIRIFVVFALSQLVQVASTFNNFTIQLSNLVATSGCREAIADFARDDPPSIAVVLFRCVAETVDLLRKLLVNELYV